MKTDIDFAITILCAESITSQLKVVADNPEDLAISAWNAQWDLILLSTIFKREIVCNIQCTHPIDEIRSDATFGVTNYHIHGLFSKPYTVTEKDTK